MGNAEGEVCKRGLVNAIYYKADALAELFRQRIKVLTTVPTLPRRVLPKVVMVVDHKGWCGERLSLDLAKRLGGRFDISIVRLGDKEHLQLDADLYLYRNAWWLRVVPLPPEVLRRTVVLVESVRSLEDGLIGKDLTLVRGVIPLSQGLRDRVIKFPCKHVYKVIPNGVSIEEFSMRESSPEEFVVGCAGNFSNAYYDNWKGFSNILVPACELAGVRLVFRGWGGGSQAGLRGEQVPLGEMSEFYKGLSCLVLMSKSEGCSGVVFEAQACGVPVICTRTGWHSEQRDTGIIWVNRPEVESVGNIIKCVERLAVLLSHLKSKSVRDRALIGLKGRVFAERYSWSKVAPEWGEAFDFYLRDYDIS